jgi:hypothetical protein
MHAELDAILEVTPSVAALAKYAEQGSIVELRGLVGPSNPGTVRIYKDSKLDSYVEMPRASIVHADKVEDDRAGRIRVYVLGSTPVTVVRIASTATTAGGIRPANSSSRQVTGDLRGDRCADARDQSALFTALLPLAKAVDNVLGTDLEGACAYQINEAAESVDAYC